MTDQTNLDHILELMAPLGAISSKRMFGGIGIFHDAKMFALIYQDTLYLKADDENRPQFEALNLPAFSVEMRGKRTEMGYYQAPDVVLDEADQMLEWSRKSLECAQRAAKKGGSKKRKTKT